MDQELQNQLLEKYPYFFSNKDLGRKNSCMAWGIACGNGWFDIISPLCFMIKNHENNIVWQTEYKQKTEPEYKNDYIPVKFDQIKEKFGGLRIYFTGGDDYVEGLVSMAGAMSYKICEVCGDRGSPNENGWISTLCEGCRKS